MATLKLLLLNMIFKDQNILLMESHMSSSIIASIGNNWGCLWLTVASGGHQRDKFQPLRIPQRRCGSKTHCPTNSKVQLLTSSAPTEMSLHANSVTCQGTKVHLPSTPKIAYTVPTSLMKRSVLTVISPYICIVKIINKISFLEDNKQSCSDLCTNNMVSPCTCHISL